MNTEEAQQNLFMAIAFSNTSSIEGEFANGVDLDCFFEDGKTPLTEAILGGVGNPQAVNVLLNLGANPDKKDRNGWTPWNACISRLHDRVVKEEQEQIQKLLLEYEASHEGEEIIKLWQHALNGNIKEAKQLLERGVNPNSNLVCTLTSAVFSGNIELVELLLIKGVKVEGNDPKDHEHLTPFIHAASGGDLEVVKFLANFGADISYEIYEGNERRNAAIYAIENNHKQVASWIISQIESKA